MTTEFLLDGSSLELQDIRRLYRAEKPEVALSDGVMETVSESRDVVNRAVERDEAVYGVNTGFGRLSSEMVSDENLDQLQKNLIRSHAMGVGDDLGRRVCQMVMFLKIREFAMGYSGVSPGLLEKLCKLFNEGIYPKIPEAGSVGASGDLAPLAHLGLMLLGEGEVYRRKDSGNGSHNWEVANSIVALRTANIEPYKFKPKEGLSIVNGTQVSLALLLEALVRSTRLQTLADVTAAMSIDALKGSTVPFREEVYGAREHPGQKQVSQRISALLEGSEIRESHRDCDRVQDSYSLRCVPQVHGASLDSLQNCRDIARREMNASTDNPLVLAESDEIISAGNFHGQPIGVAADYLCIGLSELASISERRIENLVNPDLSDLPPFLTENSGINSGMMLGQVAAASLVSENKTLSHPASVDSIPTSANREDHVSMSTFAGRKVSEVAENLERILGIELICAAQGIDYREPLSTSPPLEAAHEQIREVVEPLDRDRVFYRDLDAITSLTRDPSFFQRINDELPNDRALHSF